MSCKEQWAKEMAARLEASSRVAAGQVDGGQHCDHEGCAALVNLATNTCVRGHAQGQARAAVGGYPRELDAVWCVAQEYGQADQPYFQHVQGWIQRQQGGGPGALPPDEAYMAGVAMVAQVLANLRYSIPRTDPRMQAAQELVRSWQHWPDTYVVVPSPRVRPDVLERLVAQSGPEGLHASWDMTERGWGLRVRARLGYSLTAEQQEALRAQGWSPGEEECFVPLRELDRWSETRIAAAQEHERAMRTRMAEYKDRVGGGPRGATYALWHDLGQFAHEDAALLDEGLGGERQVGRWARASREELRQALYHMPEATRRAELQAGAGLTDEVAELLEIGEVQRAALDSERERTVRAELPKLRQVVGMQERALDLLDEATVGVRRRDPEAVERLVAADRLFREAASVPTSGLTQQLYAACADNRRDFLGTSADAAPKAVRMLWARIHADSATYRTPALQHLAAEQGMPYASLASRGELCQFLEERGQGRGDRAIGNLVSRVSRKAKTYRSISPLDPARAGEVYRVGEQALAEGLGPVSVTRCFYRTEAEPGPGYPQLRAFVAVRQPGKSGETELPLEQIRPAEYHDEEHEGA